VSIADTVPVASSDGEKRAPAPNTMDKLNSEAYRVLVQSGDTAFVEHVMTRPNGTPRTYGEMRALYG
jgi:hypothetical protein